MCPTFQQIIFCFHSIKFQEIESTSLHKDSQEAQDQLQIDGTIKEGDFLDDIL